jgi:hypothetical protein
MIIIRIIIIIRMITWNARGGAEERSRLSFSSFFMLSIRSFTSRARSLSVRGGDDVACVCVCVCVCGIIFT